MPRQPCLYSPSPLITKCSATSKTCCYAAPACRTHSKPPGPPHLSAPVPQPSARPAPTEEHAPSCVHVEYDQRRVEKVGRIRRLSFHVSSTQVLHALAFEGRPPAPHLERHRPWGRQSLRLNRTSNPPAVKSFGSNPGKTCFREAW